MLELSHEKISSLHPAAYNPRRISQKEMASLKRSLEKFGAVDPAIVNADGTIIGGHQRVAAADSLGWEEFPVVKVDLDESEARLLNLALNRISGEWDEDKLSDLLSTLDEGNADLALSGFEPSELDKVLASVGGDQEVPEPEEPPAVPTTKVGDLITLGDHRLMCGDSTDASDIAVLMDGELAQLVYTDPPYGVGYTGGTKERERLVGDEVGTDIYRTALSVLLPACLPTVAVYCWHADRASVPAAEGLQEAGLKIRAQIIWVKNLAQFGALSAQYKQQHEPCFYAHRKGSSPAWHGPTNEVTVWNADRAQSNDYHPTQKPVELAERAIGNSSVRKDVVLDGFGGSGATLLGCENLGRLCRMMELDPGYCDVIVKRWELHTGKKAERASLEAIA